MTSAYCFAYQYTLCDGLPFLTTGGPIQELDWRAVYVTNCRWRSMVNQREGTDVEVVLAAYIRTMSELASEHRSSQFSLQAFKTIMLPTVWNRPEGVNGATHCEATLRHGR